VLDKADADSLRLVQDFRNAARRDGKFMWFALKARPVGRLRRPRSSASVGTLNDVTEMRNAEERMMQDSVHDNLTACRTAKLVMRQHWCGRQFRQNH